MLTVSKTIEIFTDSSRFSDDLENLVKDYACSRCTIIVYDANNTDFTSIMELKTAEYEVTTLPAVAVSGKLVPLDKLKNGKISSFVNHLLHESLD
ncbi:hypothetical protein [Fredinandcohnia quinoae]|uniref:Thioredoxin domain-containing protein n=1 Tax=Fredinandcohnia quinoae TaxID=2918902 RepID=A0AAW5E670_9BACI|nr:hypothetical protein [Fredinandcohnia sp. SECRCQ15]MCH1626735.1 hypothetical protein [Fredinandcohnia sp. SECRCQ15]